MYLVLRLVSCPSDYLDRDQNDLIHEITDQSQIFGLIQKQMSNHLLTLKKLKFILLVSEIPCHRQAYLCDLKYLYLSQEVNRKLQMGAYMETFIMTSDDARHRLDRLEADPNYTDEYTPDPKTLKEIEVLDAHIDPSISHFSNIC